MGNWIGFYCETCATKVNTLYMVEVSQMTYSSASWLIDISLKFVPKVKIDSIPALVPIMAWHWPGNKPLSEPMIVN